MAVEVVAAVHIVRDIARDIGFLRTGVQVVRIDHIAARMVVAVAVVVGEAVLAGLVLGECPVAKVTSALGYVFPVVEEVAGFLV